MNCWTVLKLEPTSDQRSIKRAYAARLKVTRAEDDPVAFQQLREAYEQALAQAPHMHSAPKTENETEPTSASTAPDTLANDTVAHATLEQNSAALTTVTHGALATQASASLHWSNFTQYFSEQFGAAEFQRVEDLYPKAVSLVTCTDENTGLETLEALMTDERLREPATSGFMDQLLAAGFNQEPETFIPILAFVAANFGWDSPSHPLALGTDPNFAPLAKKLAYATEFKWQRTSYVRARAIWDALQISEKDALALFDTYVQSPEFHNFALRELFEEKIALLLVSPDNFPKQLAVHCQQYYDWGKNAIPTRELTQQQHHYLMARLDGLRQMDQLKTHFNRKFKMPELSANDKLRFTILKLIAPVFIIFVTLLAFGVIHKPTLTKTTTLPADSETIYFAIGFSIVICLLFLTPWLLRWTYTLIDTRQKATIWKLLTSSPQPVIDRARAIFFLGVPLRTKIALNDIANFSRQAHQFEINPKAITFWKNRPNIQPVQPRTYVFIIAIAIILSAEHSSRPLENFAPPSEYPVAVFLFYVLLWIFCVTAGVSLLKYWHYQIHAELIPKFYQYDKDITQRIAGKIHDKLNTRDFRIISHTCLPSMIVALLVMVPALAAPAIFLIPLLILIIHLVLKNA